MDHNKSFVSAPVALRELGLHVLPELRQLGIAPPSQCFPGGTPILTASGSRKSIELVQTGDAVMVVSNCGRLAEGRIGRLYQDVTNEWLILRPVDGSGGFELTVTPGHVFRNSRGGWSRIDAILAEDGLVVREDGSLLKVVGERIVYSAETAHLYEEAEKIDYAVAGNAALAPQIMRGWKTYNFEVLEHHNYIAGGLQVHNDSTPTLLVADAEFANRYGHEFTGSQADLNQLMDGIVRGDINAYGDYVGGLSDDRYTATFYDAIQNKIVVSMDQLGWSVSEVRDGVREVTRDYDPVTGLVAGIHFGALTPEAGDGGGGVEGSLVFGGGGQLASASLAGRRVSAADVGELFGSLLGKAIGNGNRLVELGAGTLLGLTLSKVGSFLEQQLAAGRIDQDISWNAANATRDSETQLSQQAGARFSADILNRLGGVGSSLLSAELADALGIHGFEGQLFTASVNGVTSEIIKRAIAQAGNSAGFDINAVLTVDPVQVGLTIGTSFGSIFGSYLGSKIVTPNSPQAAIFASAGSAIGSLAGVAIGNIIFDGIPIIGPFIGSFLGQVLGTWIGNAFYDNDDLAGVTLGFNPANGLLTFVRNRTVDHGEVSFASYLASSVADPINHFLSAAGLRLDPLNPLGAYNAPGLEVGYFNNHYDQKIAFAGPDQLLYVTKYGDRYEQNLASVSQFGIDQLVSQMHVVGGDPLLRRALTASQNEPGADHGLVKIAFDLQVAQDYRFYLDHKAAVNTLIETLPDSAFAAGWIATLTRVNELGLNQANPDDFHGSFYAHLQGELRDKLDWEPDVDPNRPDVLILRKLNHVVELGHVFGPGLVTSKTGGPGNDSLGADWGGLHEVSRLAGGDGDDRLYGQYGTDILVGGAGQDTLDGSDGHDWLAGGAGNDILYGGNGDDLLVGGQGDDLLVGGRGANVLVGGDGHDVIYFGEVNPLDTVISQDRGGQTDTISLAGEIDGRHAADGSNYWRADADLHIRTFSGVWGEGTVYDPVSNQSTTGEVFYESAEGQVVIKDFFLTRDAVDKFYYVGGGWDGAAFWRYFVPFNQVAVFDTQHPEGGHRGTAIDGAEGASRQPWVSVVSEYDDANHLITQTIHLNSGDVQVINGDADNDIYVDQPNLTWNGAGGNDKLYGGSGNDGLIGGSGNDLIFGDWGSDGLIGGSGSNTIDGGAGDDYAVFRFATWEASVSSQDGQTIVYGPATQTTLTNVEHVFFADSPSFRDGPHTVNGGVDYVYYNDIYPDVAAAGYDAAQHYSANGWHEGRNPNPYFSTSFYLQTNPDVAQSGADPYQHYLDHGGQEGRYPSQHFDGAGYLNANPDVAALGMNPIDHYLRFGYAEGRHGWEMHV